MTDPTPAATDFEGRLYDLCAKGDEDGAVDLVIEHLDDYQCEGRFDLCDRAFREIDVERVDLSVLISCLGITHRAARQGKLAARDDFYGRVFERVKREQGGLYACKVLTKYR